MPRQKPGFNRGARCSIHPEIGHLSRIRCLGGPHAWPERRRASGIEAPLGDRLHHDGAEQRSGISRERESGGLRCAATRALRAHERGVKPACKPGSVATHPKAHCVTIIPLGLQLPAGSSHLPADSASSVVVRLFGVAPGGGYRASRVPTPAVRSYRTVSPLPDPSCDGHRRSALCCPVIAFAGSCLPAPASGRYPAPCSAEPGLSSPSTRDAATVRPASRGRVYPAGPAPGPELPGIVVINRLGIGRVPARDAQYGQRREHLRAGQ